MGRGAFGGEEGRGEAVAAARCEFECEMRHVSEFVVADTVAVTPGGGGGGL